MITFDKIAEDLLKSYGYGIDYCKSDAEAIEKSKNWTEDKPYPVYFSPSNTSGEKPFEEFYIHGESVDMDRFKSLGVITDKAIPDKSAVVELIKTIDSAFEMENCTKADIVKIMEEYLPNFIHIETGKNLDGKM